MDSESLSSTQSTSIVSLDDLGIKRSLDSSGEEQFAINLGVNPVFGITNCYAVFDKATKKWKLITSIDPNFATRKQADSKPERPVHRVSRSLELGTSSWTRSLPRLPYVDFFLNHIDWNASPLGPLDAWPAILQTFCHLIFADSRAAVVLWGKDHILIPNAVYVEKVTRAFQKSSSDIIGHPVFQIWPEVREDIAPALAKVASTGKALDYTDITYFPINADGLVEESLWQAYFLPLKTGDETLGFYHIAADITKEKIRERCISTLNAISTPPRDREVPIWQYVFEVLASGDQEFPMAFAYSALDDPTSGSCKLTIQQRLGVPLTGHTLVPEYCDLYEGNTGFAPAYRKARLSNEVVLLRTSDGTMNLDLDGFQWRGSGSPCHSIAIIPIISSERLIGIVVIGLNPRRPLDAEYVAFLQSLSRQVSATISTSLDREEAHERTERLTKQLALSEQRIRDLAEVGPAGLILVNMNGTITWANEQYYAITGHPRDDMFELSFLDTIDPQDFQKGADVWKVLSEERKSIRDDFRLKRKWRPPPSPGLLTSPEEPVSVLVNAYPVVENGEITGIAGSVVDISTFKWAEALQHRSAQDAREAKRLQENFIDIVSHEMRNPLSAIFQLSDGIAACSDSIHSNDAVAMKAALEANVESANTILLCAAHQKRIIDDVLTLSKLDSMMLSITPIIVQPKTVVESVLKMFEAEFQTNDISVDYSLMASYHSNNVHWVTIDPSRLTQIFINLITNAIKFTRQRAVREIQIRVGASLTQPTDMPGMRWFPTKQGRKDLTQGLEWGSGEPIYLLFEVVDTGTGLRPEEMTKLFERFHQATAKTHIKYGGSGLGLFISRELTETQGGEIGVTSEPDKGSTFAFYVKGRVSAPPLESAMVFPSQPPELGRRESIHQVEPILLPGSPEPPMANLRLLLVEDNVVNSKVLTKQLQKAGCEVYVANHGLDCLDWLQKSRSWKELQNEINCIDFDCILMDIEMPVMDGLTATRRIRQMEQEGLLTRHLSIIAITANAREEQIQQTLQAGADAVQPKPFRVKELLEKINGLISRPPS